MATDTPRRTELDGVTRIAKERRRQIETEGWNADHDRGHAEELAMAAATYALSTSVRQTYIGRSSLWSLLWPWGPRYYKPTVNNRVRELEKAGALIAAAIDDLLRDSQP